MKPLTEWEVPRGVTVYAGKGGRWYAKDEADARFAELDARLHLSENDNRNLREECKRQRKLARKNWEAKVAMKAEHAAARAEVTALQFRVDQQRILAGFGDTDLRLAREQRDTAYRILRRIAGLRREQFASAIDMADACVQEARELFPEEDDTHG